MSTLCLSPRDESLLRLLSWTPATTSLLQRASAAFERGAFLDERRLRERLQALSRGGFVRSWPLAVSGSSIQNCYKLTPQGFHLLHGLDAPLPPRAFFAEVSPSLAAHTLRLAEAIVVVLRSCTERQVTIERFLRENELTLEAGERQVQPDCFFRLTTAGRAFNLGFEIDNSTASIDANAVNSIRRKLTTYHDYQELVLSQWLAGGKQWERPRLRVVFLTPSVERAYHILAFAADHMANPVRRLIYAATQDSFVTAADPLHTPLFLDHRGYWQALVDLHPTAPYSKVPVRLARPLECPLLV